MAAAQMLLPLLLLGVAFCLLSLVSLVVYRRWFHPLSHFPGPFIASVSGLYQTYWNFQPEFVINFKRLHEKYGPVVRYSPNGIIFNDHELLAEAYGRRADKSGFFAANFDSEATFNLQNYEDHVPAKKMIAVAYSDANLRLAEPGIDKLLSRWLFLLYKGTSQHGSVDFNERSGQVTNPISQHVAIPIIFQTHLTLKKSWLTSDAVSLLVSGQPLGFIDSESDVHGLLRSKDQCFRWINFLAIQDNLSWYIRNTRLGQRWLMARPTDKAGVGVFMRVRDRILASVLDHRGRLDRAALVDGSLLSTLLTAHHAGHGMMTLTDIGAEILFALLAGSSVTSMTLWTAIFLIARDTAVQRRLRAELTRHIIPDADASTAIVSTEQARALPYLDACVQETLRFAPTMSQLPRLSPRGTGLTLHDRFVAPGLSVSTSPWILGRSAALFGPDADVFCPQRWLDADASQIRAWNRYSFHFGYGGRKCVARRFALTQLYKAIAEIFRRFHVEPVGSTEGTSAGKPTTKMFRFLPLEDDDERRAR